MTSTSALNQPVSVLASSLSNNTVDILTSLKQAGAVVSVFASDAVDATKDLFENRGALARLTAAGINVKAVPGQAVCGAFAAMGKPQATELMVVGSQTTLGGPSAFVRTKAGPIDVTSDAAAVSAMQESVSAMASMAAPVRPFALSTLPRISITATPSSSARIADCIFCVYDLETSGLSARGDDRILSFSCKAVRIRPDGSVENVASLDHFVEAGRDALGRTFNIPADARKVNGFTHEHLAKLGAKPLAQVLPSITAFLKEMEKLGPVVMGGQNIAGFDHDFLNTTLARTDIATGFASDAPRPQLNPTLVDTRLLAQRVLADNPPTVVDAETGVSRVAWSLDAFIAYFNLPPRGVHAADEDVDRTIDVLARLIQKSGAATVGDLLTPQATSTPKKLAGFRTRLELDGDSFVIKRDHFVSHIEDAVARGDATIERSLGDAKKGVSYSKQRDVMSLLTSNGYTVDKAKLKERVLTARR